MLKNYIWLMGAGLVLVLMLVVGIESIRCQIITCEPPPTPNPTVTIMVDPTPTPTHTPTPTPPPVIRISIASSITKTEWLENAVEEFNQASQEDGALQMRGRPIEVEILLEKDPRTGRERHYNSGTQVKATLEGKIEPTILSPASTYWILTLNKEWRAVNGSEISTGPAPSLLSTPVVVAMWQSRAQALGCWPEPQDACTWKRLRELAVDDQGWGSLGKPVWGKFRFGYAYVGESDVGTQTAVLFCMVGLNKTDNLVVDEVRTDNDCGKAITDIEHAIVHRGTSSPLILASMRDGGPEFLDAVTTYEKNVIGFNLQNQGNLREPLVAVYPQDGTVVADHPFAIMDGAPWVTDDMADAAEVFQQFLLAKDRQERLVTWGMRPVDTSIPLGSPIDSSSGANASPSAVKELQVPDVLVVDQVIDVWGKLKKRSDVVLVFDKSGSMQGEKIDRAVEGAEVFVEEMDRNDWLSWLPFDSEIYPGTQGLKGDVGEELIFDIKGIRASGGTALYDAVAQAYQTLEEKRATYGDSRRYGIVVLSDGKDENSSMELARLENLLRPSEQDPFGTQIHTIGMGDDIDSAVLNKLANVTHGRYWEVTDPERTAAVYRQISKYW